MCADPRIIHARVKGQTQNMSKALATKNVAAVLLAVALVFGFAFSFAAPVKAQSIADLQAQIQALLAQIQALQGGSSSGGACVSFTFTTNFRQGQSGAEVMQIQKFLNTMADTRVAASGAGSPGNETSFFGPATAAAVRKFQEKYAADILTPVGLSAGTGYWGPSTRAKANALAAACVPGTTPGTTPGVSGTLQVIAGTQPANSLLPESSSRVPFTTFTLTNTSAAAVTVNNVTVQKTGLGDKAALDGVVLVDSTGIQLGNSKTLNTNNQAVLDAGITLQPGQSATLTVTASTDSDNDAYSGQIIGLSVVGVASNGTVSGSLPITGASHTINSTLAIGGMTAAVAGGDPDTTALNSSTAGKAIGTTGFTFASIRLTNTGSAEDEWVKSIRFNQSGSASASDLANVVVVVDGTSYPTTISSDGKYYTVIFPGNGLEIKKGLNKEFTVKADIVGGPARTVSFDIYKASDIYVVGATFGYGIVPTQSENGTVSDATELTSGTPFFSATVVQINAGTVSSVSRASEVAAQNIVILSPNQPLGGFAVDIKGESIQVASLTFGFDISGSLNATNIDSITLVDANGVVVAGPVDGVTGAGTDGKVTFTDSVTFPTGRHVYTLRGQLDSSFTDGITIIATTTPNSTYWTNAKGTITGNTITISNAHVTANTMTVRAGSVKISIASSPAAQNVVAGVSGLTVGAFNFDATQSGEDVRFSSQKFQYTDSSMTGGDVTNCYAYDGATRLNSTAVNPTTDGTDYTFSFDTQLVVSKGTVKKVDIKCDVPSSVSSGSFSFDMDISEVVAGTGVTSSQSITPTTPTGSDVTGNTQTVVSGGALTVALDSSSPSASLAAAGTSGVTLAALRFNGTNEDMRLDRVALQMSNGVASSSPSNLAQVTLWDGATQVGTAIFAGTRYATSTLTSTVTIPANGFKVLTVKGDLAGIGTGQATTTNGISIEVDYDGSDSTGTRAVGLSSGTTINTSSTSDTDVSPVRVYRSYPTFAVIDLPSSLLTSGTNVIYRFSITASNTGFGVGIDEITANIATSSISALADAKLYAFTDSGFSSPVSGFSGGLLDSNSGNIATGNVSFDLGTSELQIPAGGTRYFEVRIDATLSGTGTEQISTKIMGDSAEAVGSTLTVAASTAVSAANFVWSGNATTTSESTHLDWTNGYSVPGLPAGGSATKTLQKTN
jgi:hypothetical protein